jgi:hypothetical protein
MPRPSWSVFAVAAVLLLPLAAAAACLPDNFPPRWLEAQERQGGHTLALHVGKSDQQLVDRLNQDKRLREESSFANPAIAESAVEAALQRNRGSIEAWAAHAKPRQRHAWHFRSDAVLGRGAYRPAGRSHIAERSGVTAVVLKNADGSCTLFTAYPSR